MLIRLKQYGLQVSEPYKEGQTLTALEAKVLNALRSDRIRDRAGKVFQKILNREGLLSAEEVKVLQQRLTEEIDLPFQFRPPQNDEQKLSQLDLAIRDVAREVIEQKLKGMGVEIESLSHNDLETHIDSACRLPSVQAEGRRRLEERSKVVAGTLEELI